MLLCTLAYMCRCTVPLATVERNQTNQYIYHFEVYTTRIVMKISYNDDRDDRPVTDTKRDGV